MVIIASLIAVYIPTADSTDLSASDKALSFINNVARIDTAKYSVIPNNNTVTYPSDLGGFAKIDGGYSLQSEDSNIHIIYTFVDNKLSYFNLYTLKGSTIFANQPSGDLIKRTDTFLQNFQIQLGTNEFQQYKDILSTISEAKNTSISVGNIRFEITQFSQST